MKNNKIPLVYDYVNKRLFYFARIVGIEPLQTNISSPDRRRFTVKLNSYFSVSIGVRTQNKRTTIFYVTITL